MKAAVCTWTEQFSVDIVIRKLHGFDGELAFGTTSPHNHFLEEIDGQNIILLVPVYTPLIILLHVLNMFSTAVSADRTLKLTFHNDYVEEL